MWCWCIGSDGLIVVVRKADRACFDGSCLCVITPRLTAHPKHTSSRLPKATAKHFEENIQAAAPPQAGVQQRLNHSTRLMKKHPTSRNRVACPPQKSKQAARLQDGVQQRRLRAKAPAQLQDAVAEGGLPRQAGQQAAQRDEGKVLPQLGAAGGVLRARALVLQHEPARGGCSAQGARGSARRWRCW